MEPMPDGGDGNVVGARCPIGRYMNVFRIGFNAFEVVIEFGERFDEGAPVAMHTRVITNPILARALVDSLTEALSNYDSTYSADPPRLTPGGIG